MDVDINKFMEFKLLMENFPLQKLVLFNAEISIILKYYVLSVTTFLLTHVKYLNAYVKLIVFKRLYTTNKIWIEFL